MSGNASLIMTALSMVLLICMTYPCTAQYDPLATDIFTLSGDTRRYSSIEGEKVIIDPNADPLGIDDIMHPIDTQHTAEYLNRVSAGALSSSIVSVDLQGNWTLDLSGGTVGRAHLLLVQNREAVFGRGTMASGTLAAVSSYQAISASGYAVKDVLHLDLLDTQNLILYRCTLTLGRDFLLGSFSAYDALGRTWSGTAQANRAA